jgi:hypothetical protein
MQSGKPLQDIPRIPIVRDKFRVARVVVFTHKHFFSFFHIRPWSLQAVVCRKVPSSEGSLLSARHPDNPHYSWAIFPPTCTHDACLPKGRHPSG